MTPAFKYDPDRNCLREVLQTPDKTCHEHAQFNTPEKFKQELERRRASLRVIPCVENSIWPEVELIEGVHFEVRMRMWENRTRYAWPIQSPQPRLYTQAEAEEIWRAGYDCGHAEAAREDYIDKEQYFKTRFNEDI